MGSEQPIKIKALSLGVLANIGGSLVLGIMLSLIMGIILGILGISMNEINAPVWGPVLSLISGFGSAVLGGFVAGRVAKQKQVFHGALVGAIVSVIGLLYGFVSGESFPPAWYNIVLFVGVVLFGMLGGRIAESTCKKVNDTSPNRPATTENKELNKKSEIAPSWVAALLGFGAGWVAMAFLLVLGMAGINTSYGALPVLAAAGAISCCLASYLNRKYWIISGTLFALPIILFSALACLTEPEGDSEGFLFLVTSSAIFMISGIAGSLIGVIIRSNFIKRTNKNV
ncbi:MAG: TIGR04086 family membrane protein [Candidatus Omnitrophica bacterium]|nr:TIGR04086 family membrane protein [Candidatus Omnitrophota bacterium]MDD5737143.1 TIGR04086 family membrane protein [Candidatus Omnitrophota bacterium]